MIGVLGHDSALLRLYWATWANEMNLSSNGTKDQTKVSSNGAKNQNIFKWGQGPMCLQIGPPRRWLSPDIPTVSAARNASHVNRITGVLTQILTWPPLQIFLG